MGVKSTTIYIPADLGAWLERRRAVEKPKPSRSNYIVALLYDIKTIIEKGDIGCEKRG